MPINVNYRYVESELLYLYRDSDSVALLYDVEFEERVAATVPEAPALRAPDRGGRRAVDPGRGRLRGGAARRQPGARGFAPRSDDDLYIIYTGGTTGMPKGVMWTPRTCSWLGFWNPGEPRPPPAGRGRRTPRNGGPLVDDGRPRR